jgi:glycosyltransferase involved in cell wall biosynthesis
MRAHRAVICATQVPFIHGGAEALTTALHRELVRRGWQAEVVRLPFQCYPAVSLLKGYLAWRLLDLETRKDESLDLVIATKFPSFAIRHPRKVTWLMHQFRRLYDLYGSEYSPYGHQLQDYRLQRIVEQVDTQTLSESRRLFAISRNVAERLAYFNGLKAQVLYPPPLHEGQYHHETYGDYVLVVSRLTRQKRVDQIIKGMSHVRSNVRCLIAGTGDYEKELKQLVAKSRVGDRVEFLGYVDDERLLSLYANAMAVFYAPYDEDYGYATVEAFKAQKPVLTASDSGGVLEFVTDGETGYVVAPDCPHALAERIDQLSADRSLCRRLGEAGYEIVRPITWEWTIKRMLGGL